MQTPIVHETPARRSIADPDDFAIELAPRTAATAPQPAPRQTPPAWEATLAPRRSVA